MLTRHQPRIDISPERLRKLYVEEGLLLGEISECVGVSESTVRRRLLRLGVSLRNKGEHRKAVVNPTAKEEIISLFRKGIEDIREIEVTTRRTQNYIRATLRAAGLLTVKRGKKVSGKDRKLLKKLYTVDRCSLEKLADRFDVSLKSVKTALKESGVNVRYPTPRDPIFARLKVGQWLPVKIKATSTYDELYMTAKKHGIKISVKRKDRTTVWVTKVASN